MVIIMATIASIIHRDYANSFSSIFHLLLRTVLGSMHYYNYSTDRETETQRLSGLHKVIQIVSGRSRI